MSLLYILDIRGTDDTKRVEVTNSNLILGSDSSADIVFKNQSLSPFHVKFRLQNEVLTLTQLSVDDSTKIGRQKLKQNKMYIIDKGDKISAGDLKIIIRKEKVKAKVEFEQEIEQPLPEENITEQTIPKESEKEESQEIQRRESRNTNDTKLVIKKPLPNEKTLFPGTFTRSSAYTLTFTLAYLISTAGFAALNLHFELNPYILKFRTTLKPYLHKAQNFLSEITKIFVENGSLLPPVETFDISKILLGDVLLYFLIALFTLEVAGHLLFGLNFFYFIFGIKVEGGFIGKRIKALLRMILAFITCPFLILELPVLLKRRSFKETITFTRFRFRKKWLKPFSILIMTPILLIILLISPGILFIQDFQHEIKVKKVVSKKRKNPSTDVVKNTTSSQTYKLIVNYDPSQYSIYPNIDLKTKKPFFTVYSKEDQQTVNIKMNNTVAMKDLANIINKLDIFMYFHSPLVYQNTQIDHPQYEEELTEILEDSTTLSLLNLHHFYLKKGPFIFPYLYIKNWNLKNYQFHNTNLIKTYTENKKTVYWPTINDKNQSLITNSTTHLIHVIVEAPSIKKSQRDKIIQDIIISAKKLPKSKDLTQENSNLDFFEIIDILNDTKKIHDNQQQIIDYLMENAKELADTNDQNKTNTLINSLTNINKFLLTTKNDQLKTLRLTINRISKALKDNDQSFFNFNNKESKK